MAFACSPSRTSICRNARAHLQSENECDLILKGYIAFLDPPKDSAAKAIDALQQHGVTVKVLTGDNDLVTRKVCREVGLNADDILLGSKVETMTDDELADAAETHSRLCAPLARAQTAHHPRASAQGARRRLHGRRHQRRTRAARGRRRHLGRFRGRYREGRGRGHPARKGSHGARRRRDRRPQGFREHPQIRPHGRQLELRQHVQRPRRERLPALRADGARSRC